MPDREILLVPLVRTQDRPLALRTAADFVHHDLDFSEPTPMGFALCRGCGDYVTREQYVAGSCVAVSVEASFAPSRLGDLPCVFCSEPVGVDPMRRATVEWFGATCNACFALQATAPAQPEAEAGTRVT
jgi:hypothetical protein